MPDEDTEVIDVNGSCNCGKIEFRAQGPILWKGMCHCRACCRARGMTPVQLLAVPVPNFKVTKGDVKVTGSPLGAMTHAFCRDCGTHIFQCPAGATFRALYPTVFHELKPHPFLFHPEKSINYENRVYDLPLSPPSTEAIAAAEPLDVVASCNCAGGGVKLNVKGTILANVLDHSEAACRPLGMTPVHLCTIDAAGLSATRADLIKTSTSQSKGGPITHSFCKECGCHMFQTFEGPSATARVAVYPTTFHVETPDMSVTCMVNSLLPEHLKPTTHVHYGER